MRCFAHKSCRTSSTAYAPQGETSGVEVHIFSTSPFLAKGVSAELVNLTAAAHDHPPWLLQFVYEIFAVPGRVQAELPLLDVGVIQDVSSCCHKRG